MGIPPTKKNAYWRKPVDNHLRWFVETRNHIMRIYLWVLMPKYFITMYRIKQVLFSLFGYFVISWEL